jgi:hypothetical protein
MLYKHNIISYAARKNYFENIAQKVKNDTDEASISVKVVKLVWLTNFL